LMAVLPHDDTEAPFFEHVRELRTRIVVSAVAVLVAAVVAFIFSRHIFWVLMRPLQEVPGAAEKLLTLGPAEPVLTILRVSVYAGILCAFPIVAWQLWAFVAPALYERERRVAVPYVLFLWLLLLGGVAFGYFVVLPVGLTFLLSYGGDLFSQELRAAEYISFVSASLLGLGVVFQIPAAFLLLASLRLVNSRVLRRVRRYAVLVVAVVAMVITPTQDPVTMLVLMAPLLFLYEAGIVLVRLVERRRNRSRSMEADGEKGSDGGGRDGEGTAPQR